MKKRWTIMVCLLAVLMGMTGYQPQQQTKMLEEQTPVSTSQLEVSTNEEQTGEAATLEPEPQTPQQRAEQILAGMTVEQQVEQMFFLRFPQEDWQQVTAQYQPGGFILFGVDFKDCTPEQIQEIITSCQQEAAVPLLMGVDEEGGTVVRVSQYSQYREQPFASPHDLYVSGGLELVRSDTAEKADLLRSLGLNVNLAPVCDVANGPEDYIYPRTLGAGVQETTDFVRTVVEQSTASGIGSVLKHFPGYGGNADTHTGLSYDERTLDELRQRDFLPFQAGMDAGAGAVLVSHNILPQVGGEMPASLSPEIHAILRQELGFTGVIMTDDLDMGAIGQYTDGKAAAVQAVLAGNDLLICTDYETQIPVVIEAVNSGEISLERIQEGALRVLIWKAQLGLL